MRHILIIGGTDSSGGAGLSRDTEMATRLGATVSPIVVAVTAQTNARLNAVFPLPPQQIQSQLDAALHADSPRPQAIKIGMVGSAAAAQVLQQCLPRDLPVVLDPVFKSSSGGTLMPLEALAPLLQRADLLTPNLPEACHLTGLSPCETEADLRQQAEALLELGPAAVLIKGGHGGGAQSLDHLWTKTGHHCFAAPRLLQGKRGTGCSLATAIACELAKGAPLHRACAAAKTALQDWLAS